MDTTGAAAFFSLLYGEDRDAILGASASAIYHSGEVTDSVQICLVSAIRVMQHTQFLTSSYFLGGERHRKIKS